MADKAIRDSAEDAAPGAADAVEISKTGGAGTKFSQLGNLPISTPTQTALNAKAPLAAPSFTNHLEITEISTPSNPATNKLRVYAKDVGGVTKLHTLDAAGTETEVGTGGGGGSGDMVLAGGQTVTGAKTFNDGKLRIAG